MTLLGLILVLLAGGAVALVLTEETSRYILFGYTFELNHVQMFLAGAVTAVVLLAGLWLLGTGSRRMAKRRRALHAARAEASSKVARLEHEKRELERKLQREAAEQKAEQVEQKPERDPGDRLVAGRRGDNSRM